MREYSMTSHSYDEKLLDLRDARVHYYYSLLERYMKHVFVAGFVTGVFFFLNGLHGELRSSATFELDVYTTYVGLASTL